MSANFNLVCAQATTFNFQFQIKTGSTPWNLTNYTATMTVRPFAGSTVTTVSCTTQNGRIVIDGPNGRVTVTIDSATTSGFAPNRYVYDLVFNSGTEVTRILEGQFTVTPAVTL